MENTISEEFKAGITADWLAKAGMNRARYCLQADAGWRGPWQETWQENDFYGKVVVRVYQEPHGCFTLVRSVGNSGQASHTLYVAAVYPPGGGQAALYDYAMFAGDIIDIADAVSVENGAVGCNGQVFVAGRYQQELSSKQLTIPQTPDLASTFRTEWKLPQAKTGGQGNDFWDMGGKLFIYDDESRSYHIKPFQKICGSGAIYSLRAVEIDKFVQIPGRLMLVSNGSIFIGESVVLKKALLVSDMNIYVGEGAQVTGCLIAKGDIHVKHGAVIRYSPDVRTTFMTNYWAY